MSVVDNSLIYLFKVWFLDRSIRSIWEYIRSKRFVYLEFLEVRFRNLDFSKFFSWWFDVCLSLRSIKF